MNARARGSGSEVTHGFKFLGGGQADPVYDSGQGVWTVNDLNGIVSSGCTRGHVPLSQNQAVGGALGSFIVADRILDGDAYTVQVTAN